MVMGRRIAVHHARSLCREPDEGVHDMVRTSQGVVGQVRPVSPIGVIQPGLTLDGGADLDPILECLVLSECSDVGVAHCPSCWAAAAWLASAAERAICIWKLNTASAVFIPCQSAKQFARA